MYPAVDKTHLFVDGFFNCDEMLKTDEYHFCFHLIFEMK